jgi:choline dehydrogenase-like flavoprotein
VLIDGHTLHDGAEITASVCIVGSGPAGLTLATELRLSQENLVIIESGGTSIEAWAQALNDGPVVGGPYAGLRNTRHRQLGGTVHAWNTPVADDTGAKYAPLDPRDLRSAEDPREPSGWPIEYAELAGFYPRAQTICGLGRFDYSADPMVEAGRRPFDLMDGHLVSKIYWFGPAARFLDTHISTLCSADNVRLYTNLTVCAVDAGSPSQVTGLWAFTRSGASIRVRARIFVIACGAIENARLLLLFKAAIRGLIEDPCGWVGRGFMEHPRDNALVLLPKSPEIFERARFYDACEIRSAGTICGRLAFSDGPPRGSGLPNMSVTLLPRTRRQNSWLGRLMHGHRARNQGGYRWSSAAELAKRFDAFRLLVNLEQRPRPENRVVLSDQRDALGQPRAALHLRWSVEEQDALARLRSLLAGELESAGIGDVQIDQARRPDPNAHHHSGTTRMAETPSNGVVDRDCRVFGVDNLYVAGASVFPTAGFANPTLTIVAMACRLALHLRDRLVPRRTD